MRVMIACVLSLVACRPEVEFEPPPEEVEVTARAWVAPGSTVRADALCPVDHDVVDGTCWILGYLTLAGEAVTADEPGYACLVTNGEGHERVLEVTVVCQRNHTTLLLPEEY